MTQPSIAETFRAPRPSGERPGRGAAGVVRRAWRAAAHVPGASHGWCCRCDDAESDDAWPEAAAPRILHEPEWRIWRHLPSAALRRRWLRGRIAAKDAVRRLFRERFRLTAPLDVIGILPDAHGQPRVSCSALPDRGASLCVSISHCGNTSVALATERSASCRGVGIDVASPTDDQGGLAEGGFSSAERSLLDGRPALERSDWLLRLWCAKEAAGKALGVGLQGNPLMFVVRHIDRVRNAVEVETRFALPPGRSHAEPTSMTVRVGCDGGLVFAVAGWKGP